MHLARRDLQVRYKQTALGILWGLIRPFLSMGAFTIVFGLVAQLPTHGTTAYPLMVLAGILPWQLFATGILHASNALTNGSAIISRVYFPRLVLPASALVNGLVDFVVGLVVLVLAAGVGMVMMMLGGDSDLAADTAVATPAPVTTVFVSVEPSPESEPEPEPVAAPATTVASSPDLPAPAATQAAVEPIIEEPVGDAPPAAPQVFERYYPLYRGDQGTVVTALQELLAWRGIRTLADGDFGPATERSVRLWQAQQGLAVTGVVDDTTWASLLPTLSQGSDSDGVKVLQRMLNYWGYETVVDGDFGPQTDAAVRAFQMWRGIPVDGLVGPVTWSALLA